MLSIGNKKYRNLQEQVAYNTECIQELAKAIDGITLEDKLVIIANDSGTFTEEEMTVLNGPLAFISDGSKVWLKQSETASEFVFKAIDIVATEQGGTHYNVGGSKIVVTRATRAYVTSDDVIIVTYNKSQMDSLLALKADLSGADFTGAITAPTITEIMSGYSFNKTTLDNEHRTIAYTYAGAVKTGNKLTIAIAGTIVTKDSQASTPVGTFIIPASVGAKLYPSTIGGINNILEVKSIVMTKSGYSTVACPCTLYKPSGTEIYISVYGLGSLNIGDTYYWRVEATFLLSDNLAQ